MLDLSGINHDGAASPSTSIEWDALASDGVHHGPNPGVVMDSHGREWMFTKKSVTVVECRAASSDQPREAAG
jgi:hypothetical protein